jgi:hypothetical protein
MASAVVLSAEAIVEFLASVPPIGTKSIDLRVKVISLLDLVRPLVVFEAEVLQACLFTSAFEKLQPLLTSIDMFLNTASHLLSLPHGFEEGLDVTIGVFIAGLDGHIREIKVLEDHRCELLLQEEQFHHILQHQYIEEPRLLDSHDGRSMISQGRFGETYCMVGTSVGTTYAVKRLRLALLVSHSVTVAVLVQESKHLQALSHPHIARHMTVFLSKEERFFNIAMELVEGGTLVEKVVHIPASTEVDVAEWARQMAFALSYMHTAGVLHRDLKPENVVLTRTGEIKLVGLELPCLASVTAAEYTVYTSLERTTGLSYDGRDDVWAVGCILLELLSGARYGRSTPISSNCAL